MAVVSLLGPASSARYMDRDEEIEMPDVQDCDDQVAEYQVEVKACLEVAKDLETAKGCWDT